MIFLKNGKYRLKQIIPISIAFQFSKKPVKEKYYCLVFTSKEIEQLEIYLDKFISYANKIHANYLIFCPKSILRKSDYILFRRQIVCPVKQPIEKILQEVPLPENINLSILQ